MQKAKDRVPYYSPMNFAPDTRTCARSMYVFAAIVSALFYMPASAVIRYQPVGGVPYSVSSLTDCRRPTGMTQCTFPADFTVPVVIADRLKIVDYDIGIYANLLKASGSMQCFEAVTNVLCDLLVQPKCLGNGMVAYEPGFPQVVLHYMYKPGPTIISLFLSVATLRWPSALMRR